MSKCPICLNKILIEDRRILLCKHQFCKDCIKTWFETNSKEVCPVCRISMVHKHNITKGQRITRSMSKRNLSFNNNNMVDLSSDNIYSDDVFNDLLLDIDNNEVFRTTRSNTLALRRTFIIDEIKQLMKNMQVCNYTDINLNSANKIFQIIKYNKWLINSDNLSNNRFRLTVISKLLEFSNDNRVVIRNTAQKWYFELFGTSMFNHQLT